jgi:GNAT superfamily N-acetyltransferase
MTSYFVDQDTAATIELAEAEFMVACCRALDGEGSAAFDFAIGSGAATFAGVDSPFSKVIGVGFSDEIADAEVDALERRYAEHGAPVSFEISTLADSELAERLSHRGYRLVSFENVLVRPVSHELTDLNADIEVRRAEDDLPTWLDVAVEAGLHSDDAGVPWHREFPREELERAEVAGHAAGTRLFLAMVDGKPAGAASIRYAGAIALMTGAGTRPSYRRRGVQKALLAARLRDAASEGCELAVVTTQPGSTSQATVQRTGFDLAYVRAVMDKRLDPLA